jgi:hypothetical protein
MMAMMKRSMIMTMTMTVTIARERKAWERTSRKTEEVDGDRPRAGADGEQDIFGAHGLSPNADNLIAGDHAQPLCR